MTSRPGFWRSAVSEDSEAKDVDAGRLVVVIAGIAGSFSVIAMSISVLIRGGEPMAIGGGIAAILGGVAALVSGGGVNALLKSKGEGPPTT